MLGIVTVFSSVSTTALADSFDDQIAGLRQTLSSQQATANAFTAQANDYQTKVNQLRAQMGVLQAQINLNQARFDQVTSAIADNEAKLATEKAVLGADLKSMYVNSDVTPLEMIASSSNLSDYFNQQQYQDSIKNKIQDIMSQILTLQQQLADQKTQVTTLLATEHGQKQLLADQQAEVNQLLAVASQNAAAANAQVQQSNSQIASLKAQQAAAIAAASRHLGGGGAGCGGYPAYWCNSAQDSIIDSWGMYNRECVSYAAWSASIRFGHNVPYWGGHGNANQWPGNARASGIPVNGSPQVGDVAIYMGGYYGHAMIVEAIHSGTVEVSSFNADNTGHYSLDEWSTSALQFIHFR